MKNIEDLADLILDKLESVNAYFEIDKKKIRSSIYNHLNSLYQFEMEYAAIKMQHSKSTNRPQNNSEYAFEVKLIENKIFKEAELIAAANQKELKHLI